MNSSLLNFFVISTMKVFLEPYKFHNQPPRGVLKKSYSENMQQIYRITPIPKCDFNKFALQLYWNRTSAWVLSCKFTAYFQNIFLKNTSGQLFLICITNQLTVFYKKRILVLNVLRQNTLIAGFLQMKSITKRRI